MLNSTLSSNFSEKNIEEIQRACATCKNCELFKSRTQTVFGTGPVPAHLMIIGEGPGQDEDLQGEPFVGRSGKLLTKILESVNIDRKKDVYIANTVKCRPPDNRTPLKREIEACNEFLAAQILKVKPKILVLLGSPALKTVLNESQPISKVRGTWIKREVSYMKSPLYVMPMFHPAYLLRNPSKDIGAPKWQTWQDAKEIKAALMYYQLV